jgi:hypothetical protein
VDKLWTRTDELNRHSDLKRWRYDGEELREQTPMPIREEPAPTRALRRLDDPPILDYEDACGAIVLELDGDRVHLHAAECADLFAAAARALLRAGVPLAAVEGRLAQAAGGVRAAGREGVNDVDGKG